MTPRLRLLARAVLFCGVVSVVGLGLADASWAQVDVLTGVDLPAGLSGGVSTPPGPSDSMLRDALAAAQSGSAAQALGSGGELSGLSDQQALVAAVDAFSIQDPVWSPPQLAADDVVTSVVGDHTLVVRRADHAGPALVTSSLPLWAPDEQGQSQRVSVSLEDHGSVFEPANPLVMTRIGKEAGGGVAFPATGMRLVPAGVDVTAAGERVGDRVFYGNVAADTDWIVAPLATGTETFWQLRSDQSPSDLGLSLSLPDGARVERAPDGSGSLQVVRDGVQVALLVAPSATDAAGADVPVSFGLDGSNVTVHVDRPSDVTYPVLVDPVVVDTSINAASSGLGGWQYQTAGTWSGGYGFWGGVGSGPYGWGQYLTGSGVGTHFSTWASARWVYRAPGDSYIYNYAFGGLNLDLDKNECYTSGVAEGNWSSWMQGPNSGGTSGPMSICASSAATYALRGGGGYHCAFAGCGGDPNPDPSNPSVHGGNQAVMQLWYSTAAAASVSSMLAVGSTSVYLTDDDAPVLDPVALPAGAVNSTPYPDGGGTTAVYASAQQWTPTVSAADDGLGVKVLRYTVNNGPAVQVMPGCDGTAASRCPSTWASAMPAINLQPGWNRVVFTAEDAIGRTDTYETDIMVDGAAPTLALSGSLWDHRGRTISASLALSANAVDGRLGTGVGSDEQSGMGQLTIDMKQGPLTGNYPWQNMFDSGTQACPGGSCSMGLSPPWTWDTRRFKRGVYTVHVSARDLAGNWSRRTGDPQFSPSDAATMSSTFEITNAGGSLTTVSEGQSVARRVRLVAKGVPDVGAGMTGATDQTGVTFEYRRSRSDSWQQVPIGDVTQGRSQPVSGWPLALNAAAGDGSRTSPQVTWDVAKTVGYADGDVQVRGTFSGGSNPGGTEDVIFKLDQKAVAHPNASVPVGPGSVDLLSGNFSVSATDVSVRTPFTDLTVSRTYNSRDGGAGADGPLGPGWTLGLPVPQAGVDYASLRTYTAVTGSDGFTSNFVEVTKNDGSKVVFEQVDDTTFVPEDGAEDLTLRFYPEVRVSGVTTPAYYDLSQATGEKVVFQQRSGSASFVIDHVEQPGNNVQSTFTYEPVPGSPGKVRVKSMLAPFPAQVSGCSPMVNGCSELEFVYAAQDTQTAGEYPGRLVQINYTKGSSLPSSVARYSYDSAGRLVAAWNALPDPRVIAPLKTTYGYDSAGLLSSLTPPGLLGWTFTYATPGSGDQGAGRLKAVSRPTVTGTNTVGADAQTTIVYGVPVTGSGAPYDLGQAASGAWGQQDLATDATAVFPADQVPADPPSSYSRAAVYYLDADGREVNTATPGGAITTSEYDDHDNLIRSLTATNRERALATGSTDAAHAAQAALLDTQRTYSSDGVDLVDELGPQHAIEGAAAAREHTVTHYNDHLPDRVDVGAQVAGQSSDSDVRTTTTTYDTAVRKPASVTTTSAQGPTLTSGTTYDSQGRVTQTSLPSGKPADSTVYTHYSSAPNPQHPGCQTAPGSENGIGYLCRTDPAGPPAPISGRNDPALRDSEYDGYDLYGHVTSQSDASGAGGYGNRIITNYDAMGRKTLDSISGNVGTQIPDVSYTYDPATGLPVTASDGTRTITRAYDALGRLIRYTDADGAVSTTQYDALDRPTVISDGKGTQTNTYDSRGELTQITDSQFGTITGDYDADGNLVRETLPGGLNTYTFYDETGQPTRRCYTKATICDQNAWIDNTGTRSIHDQWITQNTSGLGSQKMSYDGAGRLTRVEDTPTGSGCTVRTYGYDANSNRTTQSTWAPGSGGACASPGSGGATTTGHTYDEADRLVDSGYKYDALGRTLTVPAADAGGQTLTDTYYANDLIRTLAQNGVTTSLTLDPAHRIRSRKATGGSTEIQHYSDDTDSPSYTSVGTAYTRSITGLGGDLVGTYQSTGATSTLQLTNLHGDVIADAPTSGSASAPSSLYDNDEFGLPRTNPSPTRRFAWLGAKQRITTLPSGIITMGARAYNPATGRFLQVDPVAGGSCNAYDYVCQDPVARLDLDGRCLMPDRNGPIRRGAGRFRETGRRPANTACGGLGPSGFDQPETSGKTGHQIVKWVCRANVVTSLVLRRLGPVTVYCAGREIVGWFG